MRPFAKTLLVGFGVFAAGVAATAAVRLWGASTKLPPAEASGGMAAFGDSLLFLGVFAIAAVPATCALFYFLRPYRRFWSVLSACAVAVAVTGLVCLALFFFGRTASSSSPLAMWAAFSVLRILAAPLLAGLFLLGALFAPSPAPRWALLASMAAEALVTVCAVFAWFLPSIHSVH